MLINYWNPGSASGYRAIFNNDVFDIGKPCREVREGSDATEGKAEWTGVLPRTSGRVAFW